MSKPRDYSRDIERMRTGQWCALCDDEQLIRETLMAKARLRRRALRPNLRPLVEARYVSGLQACESRGLGDLRGHWFRPRENLVCGFDATASETGVQVKAVEPPEVPRRKRPPLPPTSADGGTLLVQLEASLAEAVNVNGNSNGRH